MGDRHNSRLYVSRGLRSFLHALSSSLVRYGRGMRIEAARVDVLDERIHAQSKPYGHTPHADSNAVRSGASTMPSPSMSAAGFAVPHIERSIIIEHLAPKARRIPSRSWRELIKHDQTSWEVDPLLCPMDIPVPARDAHRVTHQ